jgi:hypothetical protein
MKNLTPRFWAILTLVFAAAAMRLIPHWPNFTPVAAMALFGGAYFGRKYLAFLLPLTAMLLSDLLLGFHAAMPAVYIAFAITVSIGIMISRKLNFLNVAAAALGSTVIFFLVTNFAAWLADPMYVKNFTGLMTAYVAGLAFFNDGSYGISFFVNSLMGDAFYSLVLFGAFYLSRKTIPALARA